MEVKGMYKNVMGKVIKIMGYRPVGWMYERCNLLLTDRGDIFLENGRDVIPLQGEECEQAKKLFEMENPYRKNTYGI
jgi:hypothetical protein